MRENDTQTILMTQRSRTAQTSGQLRMEESDPGQTLRMQAPPPALQAPRIKSAPKKILKSGRTTTFIDRYFSEKLDIDEMINATDHARNLLKPGEGNIRLSPPDTLPDVSKQYEIIETNIAEGGMCEISLARDTHLKRIVALKTLKTDNRVTNDDRTGFITEAQLTAQLDHPSIIPIYSLSSDTDKNLHIGMKLVHGETLKKRLSRVIDDYERYGIRQFNEKKAMIFRLNMFLNICNAISYAHDKNILHGDLKPENIMLGKYHETFVMDWGIARRIKPNGFAECIDPPGTISGTPKYISPEAVSGLELDVRADVFSLGLILFELVTLNFGTIGTESTEIMLNTRQGIFNPVRHRFGYKIDSDLTAIIEKAIKRDRNERYSSVEAMAADIRRYLAGDEVSAKPDRLLSKSVRWIRHHVYLVSISALAILMTAGLALSIIASRHFNLSREAHFQDNMIAYVRSRMSFTGTNIDKFAVTYENDVFRIANDVVFLLHHAPSATDWKKWIVEQKALSSAHFSRIEPYKQPITLERAHYQFSRKLSKEEIIRYSRLDQLYKLFREIYTQDRTFGFNHLKHRRSPLTWINVGIENGMLITYPGFQQELLNYNVSSRPWYIKTIQKAGPVWSSPYWDAASEGLLISCASRITGRDGLPFGVVTLDISLHELASLIALTDNSRHYIMEKMLLSNDGRVLVGRASEQYYKKQTDNKDPDFKMPLLPDQPLFKEIKNLSFGHLLRKEGNRKVLYLFYKLHTFPGYYVEKIDYSRLRVFFMAMQHITYK